MTASGEISWPSVGIFPWPPTRGPVSKVPHIATDESITTPPRGSFGVVEQAPLPRRAIREADPFCGPVAMRPGVGGSRSGRACVRGRL